VGALIHSGLCVLLWLFFGQGLKIGRLVYVKVFVDSKVKRERAQATCLPLFSKKEQGNC
jgi:hypothetical protein